MQVEDERRHADQYKEQVLRNESQSVFSLREGKPANHQPLSVSACFPMCPSDGESQLSHEAAEASAGGGGGGGDPRQRRPQEAAAGAGRRHGGQRGAHPGGHLPQEPPPVGRGNVHCHKK